jgi:methylenetetrahydrofolate--tRNA-(uracil-5-)-methyltransferase
VCSNSLKSLREESAAGLLKYELATMGSELIAMAKSCAVSAGGALAVDRDQFSKMVTSAVEAEPLITLVREEARSIPEGPCVIAAGPLCSESLFTALCKLVGTEHLSFFDAAAPIVDAESIDRSIAFSQSRYEEGLGDYLNCPMDKEEYERFLKELLAARRVVSRDFEESDLFNACQPVEEVARKGHDTLRFGALKPVGLVDPRTGRRPWAVVQLRPENADATAYNLVGFQTNLAWGEQARVFRLIPGLENAEFFRYGVMHRNSFVDSPRVLDSSFAVPGSEVRLAGQITGTEGYVEAMASGLLAALNTYADLTGAERVKLPRTTAFGALVAYATDPATNPYQPMHVNFGLVPPLEGRRMRKGERYAAYAKRAKEDLAAYVASRQDLFATEG